MNKNTDKHSESEMRDEYDFSQLKRVDRVQFFERLWRSRGGRVLKPALANQFEDDQAVNEALEEYLRLKKKSA